jgi:hypothetical protein
VRPRRATRFLGRRRRRWAFVVVISPGVFVCEFAFEAPEGRFGEDAHAVCVSGADFPVDFCVAGLQFLDVWAVVDGEAVGVG